MLPQVKAKYINSKFDFWKSWNYNAKLSNNKARNNIWLSKSNLLYSTNNKKISSEARLKAHNEIEYVLKWRCLDVCELGCS